MMRVAFAALMIVALAGCGSRSPDEAKAPPPEVRFATVGSASAPATISAVGTVGLRRETSLGFTSAGRIAVVKVDDGDAVRRGQLLAALDTTTVAADLSAARAERDRAASEYTRSQKLFAEGWITRPRLESAQATLAAADARVRAAGFQTSNAAIVAPGPGRILSRLAEPGQVIAAGTPVLVLGEEAGGYVLRVPLTDRDAQALSIGAPAQVNVGALGEAAVTGQVVELSGRADRATGTFVAEVQLPNDARLRAGQIGKAAITARGLAIGLVVPPAAVFAPRAGEAFVYVLDAVKNQVRLRKVRIADAADSGTRVTSGLNPGERVAVSAIDRLSDAMPVRPIGPTR
jgi:RND family efflux transporter MFP subunit